MSEVMQPYPRPVHYYINHFKLYSQRVREAVWWTQVGYILTLRDVISEGYKAGEKKVPRG